MTRAGRPGLLGLAGLALIAVACRKAAPVDPAEEAFHQAVTRFAEISALTKDLTYRDPRFDPILDALDQIPAGSEPKAGALALAERIRAARTLAGSQERGSELLQAQAEAPPAFEPQLRMPPAPAPKQAATPEAQAAPADPGTVEPAGGGPVPKAQGSHLPSWYAGYFGGSTGAGVDAGSADDAGAAGEEAPAAQSTRKKSATPEPVGPPAVFGVPGPAGGALLGKPGSE